MRLTFNVTGDDFDAELALKETSINNMVVTFDVNYSNYIQFNSDREFSHEYYDEEYESIFYNFISNNIDNFLNECRRGHCQWQFSCFPLHTRLALSIERLY